VEEDAGATNDNSTIWALDELVSSVVDGELSSR
jgi:hypothetical protein